jgi:hypothetical protein
VEMDSRRDAEDRVAKLNHTVRKPVGNAIEGD